MTVQITYRCSGCDAAATVTDVRAKRIVLTTNAITVSGMAWDKVRIERPSIESAAPDGWMVWDPYTLATYCPECWTSIEDSTHKEQEDAT